MGDKSCNFIRNQNENLQIFLSSVRKPKQLNIILGNMQHFYIHTYMSTLSEIPKRKTPLKLNTDSIHIHDTGCSSIDFV